MLKITYYVRISEEITFEIITTALKIRNCIKNILKKFLEQVVFFFMNNFLSNISTLFQRLFLTQTKALHYWDIVNIFPNPAKRTKYDK